MPNNVETSRAPVVYTVHTRPVWKTLAVALLPVLACFLGGSTEKWSEGIVVAALGLWLVFDPPRHSLGKWLNAVFIGLILCACSRIFAGKLVFPTVVARRSRERFRNPIAGVAFTATVGHARMSHQFGRGRELVLLRLRAGIRNARCAVTGAHLCRAALFCSPRFRFCFI